MRQIINQVIIRFDNAPKGIESKMLRRHTIPNVWDILLYEYVWLRPRNYEKVEEMVLRDLNGPLGKEIQMLRKNEMNPVFHLDIPSSRLKFLTLNLRHEDVRKLGRRNVGIGFSTYTEDGETKQILYVSPRLIKALASFNFSMEIC